MKKIPVLLLLFLLPAAALCEDIKLISFADRLFETGDYYRAITEYKRYMFDNPAGKFEKKAAYRIGVSFLNAGKLDDAASVFESLPEDYSGKIAEAAILAEAWVFFLKKDYQYSSTVAAKLISVYEGSAQREKAEYLTGLNLLCLKEYTSAGEVLKKLPADGELSISAVKIADYLKKSPEIQQRSPYLCSAFSAVLPGAGYAYCGKWAEALIALALNVFFIYNTYDAFKNNVNESKYAYGLPALVFYFSNIYGSAVAADRFNADEEGKFINGALELKAGLISADF